MYLVNIRVASPQRSPGYSGRSRWFLRRLPAGLRLPPAAPAAAHTPMEKWAPRWAQYRSEIHPRREYHTSPGHTTPPALRVGSALRLFCCRFFDIGWSGREPKEVSDSLDVSLKVKDKDKDQVISLLSYIFLYIFYKYILHYGLKCDCSLLTFLYVYVKIHLMAVT